MDQKRPYLGVNDAVRAIKFIIEKDMFDGEIYNVVSSNNTVRNIIDSIRETIPDVKVELVESEIMNQLSYNVSAEKIKQHDFVFRRNIHVDLLNTIQLLKNTNNF